VFAFGVVLAGFASGHIARGIASFLIIEDPLRPAVAIISLGGKLPFREIEAARLYREGWAPQVIVVRATPSAEYEALKALEIDKPEEWELSREVLKQQGVPASAIVIPKDEGVGTLEELQAAYGALAKSEEQRAEGERSWVFGVGLTGKNGQPSSVAGQLPEGEERSAKGKEHGADRTPKTENPTPDTKNATNAQRDNAINAKNAMIQRSEVSGQTSAAARDNATNATNAKNALPVILVTSKYHTRRTRLTWQYVSGGRSQPIVRAATLDPFDPEHWWQERRSILAVVREYLGLLNYYAGFPVTP
jgi:uncharacterized SAM-binding protein YcdF (DUF218 family)